MAPEARYKFPSTMEQRHIGTHMRVTLGFMRTAHQPQLFV